MQSCGLTNSAHGSPNLLTSFEKAMHFFGQASMHNPQDLQVFSSISIFGIIPPCYLI
jgi:hypothetical protein